MHKINFNQSFLPKSLILIGFILINNLPAQAQWVQQNSHTSATLSDVKMLNSVTAIAVGDSGKILRTSDAGQNWIEKFYRSHVTWNALAFANQQKGVAVGDSSKFAFTFDGGDSWIFVDSSSTRHLTAASYMGEFTLYVGDQLGTVYYSTDDGATWTSMSFGSGPVQDIFFTAGGLQQYWGHIILPLLDFETLDSGGSWQSQSLPFTIWGAAMDGEFSPTGDVAFVAGADDQFLASPVILRKLLVDTTWQGYNFMPPPPITGLQGIAVPSSQVAYACGTYGHILKTGDGGDTWNVNYIAGAMNLNALDFYDDFIGIVVGDSGTILFTTSGGTMGLYSDTELPPQNFVLYQNQPNPFNPSTTIRYQLPHAATVRLDVYNILGQKVKTIVNARQKAGFYTVQWNSTDDSGNQVSSGLYIYRLNVAAKTKDEKFVSVKKMLLVR